MKRASEAPPPDYRVDRSRWAQLVELAHAAAASDALADLKLLSERAMAAETGWTNLAPYPQGLLCRVLARTAWAYGRQIDPAVRAQMAPMLIGAAGMVDELHQQTATADTPPTVAPSSAARLPYADA